VKLIAVYHLWIFEFACHEQVEAQFEKTVEVEVEPTEQQSTLSSVFC